MQKQQLLYKGKAKSVYETEDNDLLILHFRDDTSALDGKRIEQLARKGVVNNRFNAFIMQNCLMLVSRRILKSNCLTTKYWSSAWI